MHNQNGVFITPQEELSRSVWVNLKHSSTRNAPHENSKNRFFDLPICYQDNKVRTENTQIQSSLSDEYMFSRFINGIIGKWLKVLIYNGGYGCLVSRSFSTRNGGSKNDRN